ncbi:PREDICTED: uncharacterized protein LOC100640796 [Amphimedon queenslandica]|uniref:Tudor domain-containing protein n=1 Tax=Amphimedon queenslandica TaxID=400682 RepID=A0A1X7UVX9_AMPQE|nr:PREDICTED: uncharacterized protein LOC100640796 [Amphimedon queenslandica]|eukprot:XP_019851967.1 PREDICTED: uncharacterized protein LOC100640796 [Amphimedon queenslandica]
MSKTSKARKVARGRLTEKLNRVQDVRGRLEEQLGYLDQLEDVYGSVIEEVAGGLETAVAGLVKKTETLVEGMRDVSNRTGTIVTEKKKVFEDVIQKATASTSSAFQLLENKCSNMTHQQYSTASQDLEDTLIDALTLLDGSSYQSLGDSFREITFQETSVMKIHDEVLGPLEVKIKDLKDKLDTLAMNEEPLHLLAFDDASCTASEFGDTVTESTVMENTVMENTVMENTVMENTVMENTVMENTVMENTVMENTVMENTVMESTVMENTVMESTVMENTVMENTVMENTVMENTVMENRVVENTLAQRDDALVFADSIPSLTLEVGSVLRVVVVSMDSLTSLTVQPECSDLILLSETLSELALNEELTQSVACRDFMSNLKAGQVCCARFSADSFWYRGRVLDIAYKGNVINKVSVQYVDYGNKEVLPLSSLLPLPVHLAALPIQAITCSFKGQSSFLQEASFQDISLTLMEWLERVLIGKVLKAQIASCSTSGDVHIFAELYAPTKLFVNEKSLSFLQNMKLTLPPHWITTDTICLESLIKDMLSYNMTGQSTATNDIKNMPDTVTAHQSLTSSNGQDTTTHDSTPSVSVASSLTNNQAPMRLAPSWSNIQTPFPCSGSQTHTSPVPTSTTGVTSDCPTLTTSPVPTSTAGVSDCLTLTSTSVPPLGPSNETDPRHSTEYNTSSATPSLSCSSGSHSKGSSLVEIKKGEIRVVNPPSSVVINEIEERESSIKLQEYDDEQNHLISDESSEDHLVSDESILDEWDRLVSSERDQSVVQDLLISDQQDQLVSHDQNHLVLDLRNHLEQEQLVSNQQDRNVSNEHDQLALDNQNSLVAAQSGEKNLEVSEEQDQADEYQDQLSNPSDSSDILAHPVPSIKPVHKVDSIPESVHKVDSIPEPVHKVDSIPEPVHEVDSIPESVHEVDSIPESVHKVDSIPEFVHEVDSIPESVHEVDSIPEPVHEVDSIPESVHEADSIPESVHKVLSIPEPVHEVDSIPESVPKVDSIPESVHEVDSIPESVHVVDSIPEPVHEVDFIPESVHEADSIPESVHKVLSIPEPVHKVDSIPESVPKVDSIPESVHEVDSIPESVHEVDSIPEPVHKVDSIPEFVHEVDSIPVPVHEVDSIPESVHEINSIPEPDVYKVDSIPESVHKVDSIPEFVHEVDSIPESVHEVDSIPELVHNVDSSPEFIHQVDSIPESVHEVDSIPESVHEVDSIPSIEHEVNPVPSIHESGHDPDGVKEAEEIEALLLSMECSVIDDDCITDSSDDIILSPPPDFMCQDSPNPTLDLMSVAPLDGSVTEAPATVGNIDTVSESFSFVEYGPADELSLVVSSVVSPSCFYAVPSDNAQSLESLETSLLSHYSDPVNCHVLSEGQVRVGSVCCTKSMTSEGLCYSRGIIQSIQWNLTHDESVAVNDRDPIATDINHHDSVAVNSTDGDPIATDGSSPVTVHVFCVDYGYKAATGLESLFVLEARFAALPVQCIPCSLSGVQLSTNEDTQLLDPCCGITAVTDSPSNGETALVHNTRSWSNEVVQYFDGLVRNKLLLGVVTDKAVSAGSCIGPVYLVLLYDEEKNLINKKLAKAGLALFTEGASSDRDSSSPDDDEFFNNWNPMVTDFLSQRNVIDIDDEDVGSALLGYKSTNNKVCRFYNTPQGCYDGDRCRYQHVHEGGVEQCLQDTFKSPAVPSLPPVGSMIIVVVTTIQSINCFMVHIMGPAEVLMKGSKIQSKYIRSKFLMLQQEMDEYYKEQGRAAQSFVPPTIGELVAVWSERDNHWYRAIAKDQQGASIEVFYIDIGYSELVDQERIRTIAPEFVHLPVQAVECQLYNPNLSMESMPTDRTKKMFEDLVKDRLLFARVMWRNSNGILGVELHDLQSTGVSLNETIIGKEFENKKNGRPKEKVKKRLAVQLMPG